jgi:hypothetical protein
MERGNADLGRDSDGRTCTLSDGPTVIRGLFPDNVHDAICSFLDERVPLLSLGSPLNEDNDQFIRRYAHNVPFFVNIHRQLTDFASDVFGEPVKPSYSFLSMYEDNGICPLHIDRPQCRYTIDYLIRQEQEESWPIHIGDHMTDEQRQAIDEDENGHPKDDEAIQARIEQENWHTVLLNQNDAVCYSGTHSWHYRSDRLKGKADLVFFHFVPVGFDGPLA